MRPVLAASSAFVLACIACASCAARLPHPAYTPQPTSALVQVTLPPPPARVEVVPARPSADAAWVDGEWTWRRQRWAWMPGRWVQVPAGMTFSPWVFVRGPDETLWCAPGVWRDATGKTVAAPAPLTSAGVESGAIVNADGSIETTGPTLRPVRKTDPPAEP